MDAKVEEAEKPAVGQAAPQSQRSLSTKSRRRMILVAIAAIALLAAQQIYAHYSRQHPSTEDAYVSAHIVRLAAQVSGPVAAVHVTQGQFVHKGDPLFEIEPELFQFAVDQAKARLDAVTQQADARHAAVEAARAVVEQRQASFNNAQTTLQRRRELRAKGASSQADLDAAEADYREAEAALDAARAQLNQAMAESGAEGAANADVRAAAAELQRTEHDLAETRITAPADGWISKFSLRPGAMVVSGQEAVAMVDPSEWWVDANFKETDLNRIKAGQPVRVSVDMYPGIEFDGVVESVNAGSGAVFSFLPPENAVGNWVKVAQRFTVRVRITDPDRYSGKPLRVGASAHVRVDTAAKAS